MQFNNKYTYTYILTHKVIIVSKTILYMKKCAHSRHSIQIKKDCLVLIFVRIRVVKICSNELFFR